MSSTPPEVAKDEPNTERVAWAAFNQGAFLTSKGTAFQAGIAYVPADGEFHEVMSQPRAPPPM